MMKRLLPVRSLQNSGWLMCLLRCKFQHASTCCRKNLDDAQIWTQRGRAFPAAAELSEVTSARHAPFCFVQSTQTEVFLQPETEIWVLRTTAGQLHQNIKKNVAWTRRLQKFWKSTVLKCLQLFKIRTYSGQCLRWAVLLAQVDSNLFVQFAVEGDLVFL